jgi:hypothetical protein
VKISTNWSLVPTSEIIISPFDDMVSQEVVMDVYVFGSTMLISVVSNLDGTIIIT